MVELRSVPVRWCFPVVGFLLAAGLIAKANEPNKDGKRAVVVAPVAARGNIFCDEECEFKFKVQAAPGIKGRVVWRVAAGTATVKAGELALIVKPDASAEISIKLTIPAIKEGVVLHTKLTVSVIEHDQKRPSASFEQDLWIFPKDPFADRSEWLKKLKLNLFDPKGDTAKVFTAAKIPFEECKSVEALLETKEGVVVVGEGISFKDEKELGTAVQKLAATGLTVLILAPSEGEVPIPGLGGPNGGVEDLSFRREIVRRLDKRLDPDGWLPDGKVVASSLTVKMGEDVIGGEVMPGPGGWVWIEARHGTGKGRWAFCGLAVIAKWEASPTPRFLFAKMLEYLTDSQSDQPK